MNAVKAFAVSQTVQAALAFLVGLGLLGYGSALARPPRHVNADHWQQHQPVGALLLMGAGFLVAAVAANRAAKMTDDQVDRTFLPLVLAVTTIVCVLVVWA